MNPLLLRPVVLLLSTLLLGALAANSAAQGGPNCAQTSVGLTPLSDLTGSYLGKLGGLYPGGANAMPPAHFSAGLAQAAQIVPRDAAGNPSPAGKVVLLSIGMSNATQEFSTFIPLANASPLKAASVLVVDGAQGGQDAPTIANPAAPFWTVVAQRLANAGATAAQVQAVWLKEAIAGVSAPFPQDADLLRGYLKTIVGILKVNYPNLRACYLSSRIYAGYATTSLNPEPHAYQSAFAVRELIENQIAGDPALRYDASQGPVTAPWLAWGPYLWADGTTPRSDGLVWLCSDFSPDGVHPAQPGRDKVAQMLLSHFTNDPIASLWFTGPAGCAPASVSQFGSGLAGSFGVPSWLFPGAPKLGTPFFQVRAENLVPSGAAYFVFGFTAFPDGAMPFAGGWQHVTDDLVVPLLADAQGRASLPFGAIPNVPELCGVVLHAQVATEDAGAPQGFGLSRGMTLRFGL